MKVREGNGGKEGGREGNGKGGGGQTPPNKNSGYSLVRGGSLKRGRQTKVGVGNGNIQCFRYVFGTFRDKTNIII